MNKVNSVAWHKENLHNLREYLHSKRSQLDSLKSEIDKSSNDCQILEFQIKEAEMVGKASFVSSKFRINKAYDNLRKKQLEEQKVISND